MKKLALLLALASAVTGATAAAPSSGGADVGSYEHTVMSPDYVATTMKRAIPVRGTHGSPFVIDSHGCLWGIGEDRAMNVVGASRIVDEQGKPVCRTGKRGT